MLQLKLSYGTEKISCLMSRHYVHHTYKPQSHIYQSGIPFQQKRLKYSPEPQTDRTCKTGNQDNQKYLTN